MHSCQSCRITFQQHLACIGTVNTICVNTHKHWKLVLFSCLFIYLCITICAYVVQLGAICTVYVSVITTRPVQALARKWRISDLDMVRIAVYQLPLPAAVSWCCRMSTVHSSCHMCMLHMGLGPLVVIVVSLRLLPQLLALLQLMLPVAMLPMLILESIFDLHNAELNGTMKPAERKHKAISARSTAWPWIPVLLHFKFSEWPLLTLQWSP